MIIIIMPTKQYEDKWGGREGKLTKTLRAAAARGSKNLDVYA